MEQVRVLDRITAAERLTTHGDGARSLGRSLWGRGIHTEAKPSCWDHPKQIRA
jgi:hypothetical protein